METETSQDRIAARAAALYRLVPRESEDGMAYFACWCPICGAERQASSLPLLQASLITHLTTPGRCPAPELWADRRFQY